MSIQMKYERCRTLLQKETKSVRLKKSKRKSQQYILE